MRDPVTTVTFDETNAAVSSFSNQVFTAAADVQADDVQVRANWFPRWQASGDGHPITVTRSSDGSMELASTPATASVSLAYQVQPLDWLARIMAAIGLMLVMFFPLVVSRWQRRGYYVASRESSAAS